MTNEMKNAIILGKTFELILLEKKKKVTEKLYSSKNS